MSKEKMVKKAIATTTAKVTVLEMPTREFQDFPVTQIGECTVSDFWSLNAVDLWATHNNAVLVGGVYTVVNVTEMTTKNANYAMSYSDFLSHAKEV